MFRKKVIEKFQFIIFCRSIEWLNWCCKIQLNLKPKVKPFYSQGNLESRSQLFVLLYLCWLDAAAIQNKSFYVVSSLQSVFIWFKQLSNFRFHDSMVCHNRSLWQSSCFQNLEINIFIQISFFTLHNGKVITYDQSKFTSIKVKSTKVALLASRWNIPCISMIFLWIVHS